MLVHGLLLSDPAQLPEPGWLAVDQGRIAEIGSGSPPRKPDVGDERAIICPGFIDAHIHLPQVDAIGFDGMELTEWLERVIYPAEMHWADEQVAHAQANAAYQRMLRAGTLGYAGYLTSHFHGWAAAVRAGYDVPLRGIVGQALMDRHAPAELMGQPTARLATSQRSRLAASLNPRYAVACSDELLKGVAAKLRPGAFVQTHLAESRRECERVRELFPNDANYASVYDRHGLLHEQTLLAHGLHLNEDEWKLIAARRSVVVHCPTANLFLRSGLFNLDKARQFGVRLALGSDVAAGPDFAMPRVARAMIETAKVRAMIGTQPVHIPTAAEAWDLITRGNADAMGWPDAGRLEAGAAADLLVLRTPLAIDRHLVAGLLYTWRDDYIVQRILSGRVCELEERGAAGPSANTGA